MRVVVDGKLVGADCRSPLPHGVPSAGAIMALQIESINIRLFLSDYRKGLPYEFVGDRNDRHFPRLAVRP